MTHQTKTIDRTFLLATILLVCAGFFIFSSASLGLVTREGISYTSVILKQFLIGFVAGGICLFAFAAIDYKTWQKYAFYIFLVSLVLCAVVFLPKIGFAHGGARRWIEIGHYTFQPAELLKLGVIIYFAAWIATVKGKIKTFKFGAVPLFVILAIVVALILKQPDTGTFMVIFIAIIAVFIAGGGQWRYILLMGAVSLLILAILAFARPYIMARFLTFMDPSRDALGSGYQLQQSLIAVGSGGINGRGFGQSIQKFSFLPEPIGDSIFAVFCEEFGFIGSLCLISLFLFFALRGYKIASRVEDTFGRLVVIGIITLIISQSFINMGAMLGLLPLTGIPLIFVSQGGTALLFGLAGVGIILNISKYQKV